MAADERLGLSHSHCYPRMLFVVYSGFLRTIMVDDQGREKVLAFPMKGDILGIDGIHGKRYATEAVALTHCEAILIPFKHLTALGKSAPELEVAFYSVMCHVLLREQAAVAMLGSLTAEARVARFLLHLSDRFGEMGYSGTHYNLRMSRADIGSYFGLTLETLSRTVSGMTASGLISVDLKSVQVLDKEALPTLRRLPPRKRVSAARSRATTAIHWPLQECRPTLKRCADQLSSRNLPYTA